MKCIGVSVAILCVIVVPAVCSIPASRAAEPVPADFSRVQVVAYASGLTGFFDASTGTLYVYDSSFDKCVFIRKISKLGDPMQVVRDPKQGG